MRKKMLMSFCAFAMTIMVGLAQSSTVTGKVVDDKGSPVNGASVVEKGTRNGTSAGVDGSFSLKVKTGASLVISALGFENKTVAASSSNLAITLAPDVKALSEVVVTGSGVATSKKKLGIAVESISGSKLPVTPAAGIDQALIGKIPGAQISSVSGNPGDQVNIVLRGINTVQGGTRPLILLDGAEIPFSNLTTLDLTQVERVEVVQGAAASSIYGAQGANGVIQIFSKKGVKGKININVSSGYASNSFINAGNFGKSSLHPYLTDASGNMISQNASGGFAAGQALKPDPNVGGILGSGSLAYRYGTNIGTNPGVPGQGANYTRYGILDPRNISDQPYKGNLQFVDHFAQVLTGSSSINNSLNVSGGSDKMDFSLSFANNHSTSPFLKENGYLDRTNVTANIGVELFKGFTLRSITSIAYVHNTMHPGLGAPGGQGFGYGNSNAGVGTVYGFLNTSPFLSLTDTIVGGHYGAYQKASFVSVNAYNPYYQLDYTQGDSKQYTVNQNLDANYKVNKILTLNAKYGINYRNENDLWTYYNQSLNASSNYYSSWASAYNGDDNTGELVNYQYSNTKQNFQANAFINLDFQRDFNLKLPIQSSTQVGYDFRKNKYSEYDTRGYSLPLTPPFNMNATQLQFIISDYVEPFVTYGYLVNQKFDIGNYGGVTAGFRTDYSSAFGAGSKPFTFPHYNGYLNVDAFKFWDKMTSVVPGFKLRAAYGQAGIQPGPFDRYASLIPSPVGTDLGYANRSAQKNPDLGVEVSAETEIGTDLSFNINKSSWFRTATASFTYWSRHTDNAIYYQNVPPSTGASSILTNAIALSSKGWQLSINLPVYSSKNFQWDLTTNFSHQTSLIDAVAGGDIPLTSSAGSSGLILAAGRKIGEIYGYHAITAVDQLRADGVTPFIPKASQSAYEIVNGRVVNTTTRAIYFSDEASSLGDPNPTLTSSFINNFTYKNFITFGFQFDWINGSHLYNQTNEWMYRDGISSDFAKPVTIGGTTAAYTAYYASAYYALGNTAKGVGNNVTKDYFYYDASFVRLRNISLGIDLAGYVKQAWLKKCQLVFSGRNLLTFTKYPGFDPEISSGASNSAFDRGIDHSTIPNMKSYQVTLNLGF
ncbi:MAG: SusC/RagA family TonB-linked outer membrane protein [Bacteroidetes bacterium]|nr:SusC/RagA family TonB-linked outer membrane protein [Bacteroidota bacterium]